MTSRFACPRTTVGTLAGTLPPAWAAHPGRDLSAEAVGAKPTGWPVQPFPRPPEGRRAVGAAPQAPNGTDSAGRA